jgi:hypothetical protein
MHVCEILITKFLLHIFLSQWNISSSCWCISVQLLTLPLNSRPERRCPVPRLRTETVPISKYFVLFGFIIPNPGQNPKHKNAKCHYEWNSNPGNIYWYRDVNLTGPRPVGSQRDTARYSAIQLDTARYSSLASFPSCVCSWRSTTSQLPWGCFYTVSIGQLKV